MGSGWNHHAKQRDDNERHIIDSLTALGFVVIQIDEPADLLAQCRCGQWSVLEIKNPKGRGKRRTRKQQDTLSKLHRPIPLIISVHEALTALSHPGCDIPERTRVSMA